MTTVTKYPKMTTVAVYSLGVFLGLLHIFFGVIALSPLISQDYHREVKINYNAFAKSLSFLHQYIDRVSLALYLRYVISLGQLLFGAALLENGHFGPFSKIGNFGLVGADLIYLVFQISVGSSFDRIAPTVVFTVLLLTRLLFAHQSTTKAKVGVKTRNAGKPKTSTPKKNKNE